MVLKTESATSTYTRIIVHWPSTGTEETLPGGFGNLSHLSLREKKRILVNIQEVYEMLDPDHETPVVYFITDDKHQGIWADTQGAVTYYKNPYAKGEGYEGSVKKDEEIR